MDRGYRLWAMLPIVILTLVWTSRQHQYQAPDGLPVLLLTEVYYNTPGIDEEREWIELVNTSRSVVDLSAYAIGDEETAGGGEGMARFPEGATIDPGQVIVVAQTSAGFSLLFGRPADFEFRESDPSVSNMLPYPAWARGEVGLANQGDEVLILDINDNIVDSVAFGEGSAVAGFRGPAVANVFTGQSIERAPASCDSNTAVDWQPRREPAPGTIELTGDCRVVIAQEPAHVPIGSVQGRGDVAAAINQEVTVRGIVTGLLEDQNAQGVRFYTFFIQDVPGTEDGDPSTSDGLPVFHGSRQPPVVVGDIVWLTGRITEFYGLTEMDNNGLTIFLESSDNPLPQPVELDPPAENDAAAAYFEAYEGMRVSLAQARVIGPTFSGCSFAVTPADSGQQRIVRQSLDSPVGQNINVLHTTDVDCSGFPALVVGDRVAGLVGPLTYHFDLFKIVLQDPQSLTITPRPDQYPPIAAAPAAGQFSLASFNVDNYFDTVDDTGDAGEPKPTAAELAAKQAKLIAAIGTTLRCPTFVGLQEVENEALLINLAQGLATSCGFTYQVSHRESADPRGIDVALLTDPRRVMVSGVVLRQGCTRMDTDVFDPRINCPIGQRPLFSRPPLQVTATIDGRPLVLLVNHFKSKSGGEAETADRRLAQAQHVNGLVGEVLTAEPQAAVVVMGDFNDYEVSEPTMALTEGGRLSSALTGVPLEERYSYIFSGASQLLDNIFVSPVFWGSVVVADILHINADYPYTYDGDTSPERLTYRISDHDIPYVIMVLPAVADEPDVRQSPTSPATLPGVVPSPTPPTGEVTPVGLLSGFWLLFGLGGVLVVALIVGITLTRQSK
jgi:uncharacterized protein